MTLKELVIKAVHDDESGDSGPIDLILRIMTESEEAKHILRSKGYGVLSTGIVQTAEEVPCNG